MCLESACLGGETHSSWAAYRATATKLGENYDTRFGLKRPLHSLSPPLGCCGGGGEKPGLSLAGIHPEDPEYYFRVRGTLQRSCNRTLSFDTGSFRILGCELLNCSAHQATVKGQSESCPVVSDSLRPPWTIQSREFSRPEYWSG